MGFMSKRWSQASEETRVTTDCSVQNTQEEKYPQREDTNSVESPLNIKNNN